MRKVSEGNRQRLDKLRDKIIEYAGVDIKTIKCRKGEIVRCKAVAINIAIRNMGMPLEQVADYLGYRDHTVVMHHRDNHFGRFNSEDLYADVYLAINKEISPQFDPESKEVFKLVKSISL